MKTFVRAKNSARKLVVYAVAGCFLLGPYGVSAQQPLLPPNLISSEVASLSSFLGTLDTLSTKSETLEARTKVTEIDKEHVTALSAQLKSGIPTAKQDLESVISKVKGQGKWTPEFDSQVIAQISKMEIPPLARARFIELIKENGGPRAVLEKGVQGLAGAEKDINDTLHSIQQKHASSSWFIGTANAKWGFWRCIGVLAIGVAAGMAGAVTATYGAAVAAAGNC
jgi:hypothetical protein